MPNFQPAGTWAQQYGAKCLVYGPPGAGKTPIINTAPRPVMIACETGLLSMKGSTVPCAMATTPETIADFFQWLLTSHEAKNYDTICLDSGSQMCQILLNRELSGKSKSGNKVDGKAAYGAMANKAMEYFNQLYFMAEKHVYIICKCDETEPVKKPYFPGQMLNAEVPYLYDEVLYLSLVNIQGVGEVQAMRTKTSYDVLARDRSGNLAEFEPPHLTNLFNKILG